MMNPALHNVIFSSAPQMAGGSGDINTATGVVIGAALGLIVGIIAWITLRW